MFALFFSLYLSMFTGRWSTVISNIQMNTAMKDIMNSVSQFLTSIFGDNTYNNLGNVLWNTTDIAGYSWTNAHILVSYVLALITSIGIVVMAVKGIKKAFGIFFGQIR